MTSPFQIDTSWQANLLRDDLLGIGNNRSYVPAADIGLDHHTPLAILAADLIGSVDHLDVGNTGKRHTTATRDRYRNLLQHADIRALGLRETEHHRKPAIAFEDLPGHPATERGCHRILNVLRRDPKPRHCVAVDANVEHGKTGCLLYLHISCALGSAQHGGNLLGRPIHLVEVVAEDLDCYVTANAGD